MDRKECTECTLCTSPRPYDSRRINDKSDGVREPMYYGGSVDEINDPALISCCSTHESHNLLDAYLLQQSIQWFGADWFCAAVKK